jgi:pantothenate kinase
VIGPKHQIVLIEGLYVALDVEPWASAARLLDERWVILLHEQLAEERIWRRHVASGICNDESTARSRAVNNDIPSKRDELQSHPHSVSNGYPKRYTSLRWKIPPVETSRHDSCDRVR